MLVCAVLPHGILLGLVLILILILILCAEMTVKQAFGLKHFHVQRMLQIWLIVKKFDSTHLIFSDKFCSTLA